MPRPVSRPLMHGTQRRAYAGMSDASRQRHPSQPGTLLAISVGESAGSGQRSADGTLYFQQWKVTQLLREAESNQVARLKDNRRFAPTERV